MQHFCQPTGACRLGSDLAELLDGQTPRPLSIPVPISMVFAARLCRLCDVAGTLPGSAHQCAQELRGLKFSTSASQPELVVSAQTLLNFSTGKLQDRYPYRFLFQWYLRRDCAVFAMSLERCREARTSDIAKTAQS